MRLAEAITAWERILALDPDNDSVRRNIDEACRLLEDDVAPIDDLRSTRAYRLEVSRNILRAFLKG